MPQPLCPWERVPDNHWMGCRAILDAVAKRRKFTSLSLSETELWLTSP